MESESVLTSIELHRNPLPTKQQRRARLMNKTFPEILTLDILNNALDDILNYLNKNFGRYGANYNGCIFFDLEPVFNCLISFNFLKKWTNRGGFYKNSVKEIHLEIGYKYMPYVFMNYQYYNTPQRINLENQLILSKSQQPTDKENRLHTIYTVGEFSNYTVNLINYYHTNRVTLMIKRKHT